ncbi:MAG: hypothetical protein L3J23_04680 [Flavobacteriaceae bacterium]|nr:hypothetical protein [Flavobacteriaceae bacterium]
MKIKKLKIIIGLLIGLLIFESCSKDSNEESKVLNHVVGIWKPIKEGEIYTDQTTSENAYNECAQKSSFNFLENGTLLITEFFTDEVNEVCIEKTRPTFTLGKWEEINKEYRIITSYTCEVDNVNFTKEIMPVFTFNDNDTALRIKYATNEVINGKHLEFYYTDFIKVE